MVQRVWFLVGIALLAVDCIGREAKPSGSPSEPNSAPVSGTASSAASPSANSALAAVPPSPSASTPTRVSGRLPPEEIQAVVRAAYGGFRTCYEHGLRRNPQLRGDVSTRFVIDLDGSVRSSALDSTTLP